MKQFLQFWPMILVALNVLTAWAAWSLNQIAKNAIGKAVERLDSKDESLGQEIENLDRRVIRAEGRIGHAERAIDTLPTKADLARLEGEVKGVAREVGLANKGIDRIEGYFLEKGVESR